MPIEVCRRALERLWRQRVTANGETNWAFQLERKYCFDWLFLSPGLCVDPSAAAGSTTLNPALGIRLYQELKTGNNMWITGSDNKPLGNTIPVWSCPSWVESYIPWMGQGDNPGTVLIEFYTNGGIAPASGSIIEFSIAPYVEG